MAIIKGENQSWIVAQVVGSDLVPIREQSDEGLTLTIYSDYHDGCEARTRMETNDHEGEDLVVVHVDVGLTDASKEDTVSWEQEYKATFRSYGGKEF